MSDFNRNTPEYSKFRAACLKRDFETCRICGKAGNIVHHIFPVAIYPQIALEPENGVTLCQDCHNLAHNWGGNGTDT